MTRTEASTKAALPRNDLAEEVRRAFNEFLALPTLIIIGFLSLAVATYAIDFGRAPWLESARRVLEARVLVDATATGDLLRTIAGGLITVTSITISLLLLALQQVASSLTAEVYDQFLHRRQNQAYFGFFVGVSLYALVTLATVNENFNPVFGATVAFGLTVAALYILIVLLYTTINQMRPDEVIYEIQRLTLAARQEQLSFIARTRRRAVDTGGLGTPVRASRNGYVTKVDLDELESVSNDAGGRLEFILPVSIGSYVTFGDVVAHVSGEASAHTELLGDRVRAAIRLERQQDLPTDPGYGIDQLEAIGWTSASTAKSDHAPAIMAVRNLRDILARWVEDGVPAPDGRVVPVVYVDDVPARLLNAFESIAVASTESMQHQTLAEVLRTFTLLFDRLPAEEQIRAEDLILRVLSGLGDHVLTAPLEHALRALADTLGDCGRSETAAAVRTACDTLAQSVGIISSRADRLAGQRAR